MEEAQRSRPCHSRRFRRRRHRVSTHGRRLRGHDWCAGCLLGSRASHPGDTGRQGWQSCSRTCRRQRLCHYASKPEGDGSADVGGGCRQEKEVMPASTMTPDDRRIPSRIVESEFFVLFLCVIVFSSFAPFTPGFVSPENLGNILIGCLPLLLLATGQTLVLITGGIDLSAAAIIGLSSVV